LLFPADAQAVGDAVDVVEPGSDQVDLQIPRSSKPCARRFLEIFTLNVSRAFGEFST
jgi:hypothetical protein